MVSPPAPFLGLAPFGEQDAPYFFGRAGQLQVLADNLLATPLTVLYGATGVGKSSLLAAGILYRFRQRADANLAQYGAPEVAVAYINSWRDDPVANLHHSIAHAIERALPDAQEPPHHDLLFALRRWTERINGPILVVLDQFEEYFLYQADDASTGLAYELPRIIDASEARTSFLVSIRDDALAWLDFLRPWIPSLFQNCIRLHHLTVLEARQAILGPIDAYNRLRPWEERITVEPTLVEALLEEIRFGRVAFGAPGQGLAGLESPTDALQGSVETPWLQLVLRRLWDAEQSKGSLVLRLTTLRDELGGAGHIVRTHLDASMGVLPPAQQRIAARAFQYLVTPSGTKFAHLLSDLSALTGIEEQELAPVLDKLVSTGILRQASPSRGQGDVLIYEVFHDILAPAILDWRNRLIQEDAAGRRR